MLAILIDIAGGYLAAKHIQRMWVLVLASLLIGIASSFIGGMLMHLIDSKMFPPGETVVRIISGAIWHPIITLVSALWRRRCLIKKSLPTTEQETSA